MSVVEVDAHTIIKSREQLVQLLTVISQVLCLQLPLVCSVSILEWVERLNWTGQILTGRELKPQCIPESVAVARICCSLLASR